MNDVQTDEPQLVRTLLTAVPRVNLLPPEIEERRRFRRIQYGLGSGVLAAVGLVALVYAAAAGSAQDADEELIAAQAQHSRVQAEATTYSEVTAVYAKAAAAQAMLTQAMGDEVRYSRLLNDLSLTVPENVWIKNLSFAQAAVPATLTSAQPGIGTMTVTGVGYSHEDVAVWLESLAGQESYADPYFSSSTEGLIGARQVVDFTSTATVTADALSGRYTTPAGG